MLKKQVYRSVYRITHALWAYSYRFAGRPSVWFSIKRFLFPPRECHFSHKGVGISQVEAFGYMRIRATRFKRCVCAVCRDREIYAGTNRFAALLWALWFLREKCADRATRRTFVFSSPFLSRSVSSFHWYDFVIVTYILTDNSNRRDLSRLRSFRSVTRPCINNIPHDSCRYHWS